MQFDIRRFDVYRKIPKDLTQPTYTGGGISICCTLFILYLLIAEFYAFIIPTVVSELYVGHSDANSSMISVKLDISVFGTQCQYLGLDLQDDLGRHEIGHIEDTSKVSFNKDLGCRMNVAFKINRVPGNFHVSTHAARAQPGESNMSHRINSLIFGDKVHNLTNMPESSFNSLDEHQTITDDNDFSHDYIMKIVPTIYESLDNQQLFPFQYTYAYRKFKSRGSQNHQVPAAIWFRYEMNPITVKYVEQRQPIYHFLTTICAIVGGTFTVAGIVDSLLFTATETFKKFQQGKLQ